MDRGIKRSKRNKVNSKDKLGKKYILGIGIDEYLNFQNLSTCVNEVKEILEILHKKYGFPPRKSPHVIELYNENASYSNIIRQLENLESSCTENDTLLIIYSGHGDFKERNNTDQGYLIPFDGDEITGKQFTNCITTDELRDNISNFNALHIGCIVDCCFGQKLFNTSFEKPMPIPDVLKEKNPSRYFISSSTRTTADDGYIETNKSPFAEFLILNLKENLKRNLDFHTLALKIEDSMKSKYPSLKQQVGKGFLSTRFTSDFKLILQRTANEEMLSEKIKNIESLAKLKELEEDILDFEISDNLRTLINQAKQELETWNKIKHNNNIDEVKAFLSTFKNGRRKINAEEKLEMLVIADNNNWKIARKKVAINYARYLSEDEVIANRGKQKALNTILEIYEENNKVIEDPAIAQIKELLDLENDLVKFPLINLNHYDSNVNFEIMGFLSLIHISEPTRPY